MNCLLKQGWSCKTFSNIMPLHAEMLKSILTHEKKNKGIIITDHMHRYITDISDHLYVITNGKAHLTKGIEDLKTLGYIHTLLGKQI